MTRLTTPVCVDAKCEMLKNSGFVYNEKSREFIMNNIRIKIGDLFDLDIIYVEKLIFFAKHGFTLDTVRKVLFNGKIVVEYREAFLSDEFINSYSETYQEFSKEIKRIGH